MKTKAAKIKAKRASRAKHDTKAQGPDKKAEGERSPVPGNSLFPVDSSANGYSCYCGGFFGGVSFVL